MFPAKATKTCPAVCLALVVFSCAVPCVADELEPSLKQAYEGKVFVIRGFYSGNKLRYDSSGKLTNHASPGPWTIDGLARIEKVSLKKASLQLKCRRLVVTASDADLDYREKNDDTKLEIDADLGSNSAGRQAADALFPKIFVLDRAAFPDLVPSFWKACVDAAVNGTKISGPKCYFSSSLGKAIGPTPLGNSDAATVVSDSTQQTRARGATGVSGGSDLDPPNSTAQAAGDGVFRVGHGVSRPQALYAPDPPYAEPARKGKFQGSCVLALVIDSSGLPRNIEIQRPLGYGLDEQAVAAVENWRFAPAMKDGHPVAIRSEVEVSFRLY